MSEKKLIPYAVMNWEKLVDGHYVVDHTRFIPELEKCQTPVFLRPKRFGKSVICSMLEHYYDVNRKDDFERLFGWSDIGKDPTKFRNSFLGAARDLITNGGTWENLFEQYWIHYVKARIPAQAFDKINENFFRLTFTSRTMDALLGYYSFEQEYNTPEGRVDFLATPRPGNTRPALLIEYKYFKSSELAAIEIEVKGDGTCDASKRTEPDAETLAQARRYRDSLPKRHGWDAEIVTKAIEVYCHYGYKWFEV